MATLALSSLGSAVGGPVGAAVGATIGRQIDRSFQGSGGRRVRDLRLQRSQYGEEIPAIFGRMRVAGTVVWASEARPVASVSKNGSIQAYTASFAVALSSRPVDRILRIWGDSRLVRGASGDPKIPFTLRVHHGGEDQEVDPLIASIEGAGRTPAYRGLCLAVFENFDLSSFGNRIPQLTFEVDAGEWRVGARAALNEILHLPGSGEDAGPAISGFALEGDRMGDAVAPLTAIADARLAIGVRGWELAAPEDSTPAFDGCGNEILNASIATGEYLSSEISAPTRVSLRFFDQARDYCGSEQAARVPGPDRLLRIDFPGVLLSDDAKGLAQKCLARVRQGGCRLKVTLPSAWVSKIKIGERLRIDRRDETFLVTRKRLRGQELELWLDSAGGHFAASASDAGRARLESDFEPLPLRLIAFELPQSLTEGRRELAIAISGGVRPFRAVPIVVETPSGPVAIASPTQSSAMGALDEPLPQGPEDVFDDRSAIVVSLGTDDLLLGVTDEALLAGANLAWVNGEILQFGIAEALGGGRYQLRRLLRGRHGTTSRQHAAGSPFVLLEKQRLASLGTGPDVPGTPYRVSAQAVDGTTTKYEALIEDLSSRPWKPAHLQVEIRDECLTLYWVRRGREGLAWVDHVDAAAGRSGVSYSVTIRAGPEVVHIATVEASTMSLPLATFALPLSRYVAEVREVGALSLSEPAEINLG